MMAYKRRSPHEARFFEQAGQLFHMQRVFTSRRAAAAGGCQLEAYQDEPVVIHVLTRRGVDDDTRSKELSAVAKEGEGGRARDEVVAEDVPWWHAAPLCEHCSLEVEGVQCTITV